MIAAPRHSCILSVVAVFPARAIESDSAFLFHDTATTEIYTLSDTLSLHDALPIPASLLTVVFADFLGELVTGRLPHVSAVVRSEEHTSELQSPLNISYAVFCL